MEQMLILVDEHDNPTGYAPRSECHKGAGRRHRAIVVLLSNSEKQVLLQRRKSALWDGFWDITGATHTLHYPDHDESYEDATRRCLRAELNIEDVAIEKGFGFNYFERFNGSCENEYCMLLTGKYDGPVAFNPEYAYGVRWPSVELCQREIKDNPSIYTPWARIVIGKLSDFLLTTL